MKKIVESDSYSFFSGKVEIFAEGVEIFAEGVEIFAEGVEIQRSLCYITFMSGV